MSGLKASKMHGSKEGEKYWNDQMMKDGMEYQIQRAKNEKTPGEKEKWTGFASLKKASTEYKRSIGAIFKNKTHTTRDLFLYTKFVIIRFYSSIAFRNDLATLELKDTKTNNVLRSKKGGFYEIVMRKFKASERIGDITVEVDKNLSKVLRAYIKYRSHVEAVTHDYLLSNSKGAPLSKRMVGNILRELTLRFLGKKFATRQIRIMKATQDSPIVASALKVSSQQLHGLKQHQEYNRK